MEQPQKRFSIRAFCHNMEPSSVMPTANWLRYLGHSWAGKRWWWTLKLENELHDLYFAIVLKIPLYRRPTSWAQYWKRKEGSRFHGWRTLVLMEFSLFGTHFGDSTLYLYMRGSSLVTSRNLLISSWLSKVVQQPGCLWHIYFKRALHWGHWLSSKTVQLT